MQLNMYKNWYIYLFIILLYESSLTDIEHSPSFTAFGQPLPPPPSEIVFPYHEFWYENVTV